jgi:large subunit ribosomal protein L22
VTGPKTNEREGTRALLRSAPISAYKVREVLDLIRGESVERAVEILRFCDRGAADTVAKVLNSAVANAGANDDLKNPEELFVSACYADEGKTMRRMRPRARGRATRIRKRSSHITVIVSRMPEEQLRRVRARMEAEQAARRARRVGGRARRRRAEEEVPAAALEAEVLETEAREAEIAEAEDEQGIVDPQAAEMGLADDEPVAVDGEPVDAEPVEDEPVGVEEAAADDATTGEDVGTEEEGE